MNHYTVGIDIGTTATKVVLLDPERGVIAQVSRLSELYSDNPGWAEADPSQWLSNTIGSIRRLLEESRISGAQVGGLSASGMVPAVLPVDRQGRPLRRAMLQNDARAVDQIAAAAERLSHLDLVSLTGSSLTQQSVAPTALWLARHEPEVWRETAHLVGSYDWVLMALGARPHVEQNWAIESGLFRLGLEPLQEVLDVAAIPGEMLPSVLRPGQIAGRVSREVAAQCGLLAGTPLVVGGADHVLSAFAAGVEDPGDGLIKLGGAGDILVASNTEIKDPRLYLDAHPVPGRWLPNGCMATSGSLVRWYQGMIGAPSLADLDVAAACQRPAEVLCLPYFLGEKSPLHDPDLRGAFAGLHLGHTKADLYRAVLESIAYGFRHHLEVFSGIGVPITRVMVTNGGSKSTLWKQINADVLNMTLRPVSDHPGASLGAAILALMGIDEFPQDATANRYVTLGEPITPDPGRAEIYQDAYSTWRDLSASLTPISHHLARRTRS
jgi:xylulokinase